MSEQVKITEQNLRFFSRRPKKAEFALTKAAKNCK